MTGDELAEALERWAATLRGQPKLASVTLRVAPATDLVIGTEEAQKKDRQRRGSRAPREPDSPGQKRGQKRDIDRDKNGDKNGTGDGPEAGSAPRASRAPGSDLVNNLEENRSSGSDLSEEEAAAAAAAEGDKKRDTDGDRKRDSGGVERQVEGKIPCPPDLKLSDDQRAMFEMQVGVAGWVIDELTTRFVVKNMSDPDDRRSRATWLKCLSQVVSQDGRDLQRKGKPDGGSSEAPGSSPSRPLEWKPPTFKPDPTKPPPPSALRLAPAPRAEVGRAPAEREAESGVVAAAVPVQGAGASSG